MINTSILNQIVSKFNLSGKERDFLLIVQNYFDGKIEKKQIAYALETVLGLDMETAITLARELRHIEPSEKNNILNEVEDFTSKNIVFDQEISKITEDLHLNFDEMLQKRFGKVFLTWLQEVRNDLQVIEMLLRSDKTGGLGLSEAEADAAIARFKEKKKEWLDKGIDIKAFSLEPKMENYSLDDHNFDVKSTTQPDKNEKFTTNFVPEEETTIKELLKEKENAPKSAEPSFIEEIKDEEEFLEEKEEIAPPPPMVRAPEIKPIEVVKPVVPVKAPEPVPVKVSEPVLSAPVEKTEPIQPVPVRVPVEAPTMMRASKTTRPKVDDVVFTPKLVGPVEELGNLNIVNFRRIATDPQKAVQKIIDKLNLLGDESLEKKVQAITALKKSPLYAIYSNIISRSFNQGKPVSEVISLEDGLTLDEFKAIMDLNKLIKN